MSNDDRTAQQLKYHRQAVKERMAFAACLRRHRYAPRTIRLYANTIRVLDEWLRARDSSARACTVDELIDYADTLPFTYASQQRIINAHKAYWRHYLGRKAPSLSEALRCPVKPEMTYRGLEPEQAHALISEARRRGVYEYAATSLMYYAALIQS